ncbi:hypothetical protein [Streptomyces sp. NPDC126503]|uniref:hypothetical protein n=1 Tax=Streptomyces sp. NPDC126503 TaxID=3155315 RepID=UPI00331BF730
MRPRGESHERSQSDRDDEETIITALRKTLTATAIAGAVLAGTAACGTVQQLSAGQKLDQAFEKLGQEKSISFEVDLDTDAATIKRLDGESDPAPGTEIPQDTAELLSEATLSFTVESTKPLAESGEKDVIGTALKVTNPDGDLLEYRTVGDYTYLRADVEALTGALDGPLPTADELPPEAAGLKKALEGEWVKFRTDAMKEAGEELNEAGEEPNGGSGEPPAGPSLDPKTQKKLLESVREVVARDVDFTTAGGEDGTEHITASAPFRTLITDLVGEIRPFAKDLPVGTGLPSDEDLKEAPDGKVTADFTLRNGALFEVYVDLTELAEAPKGAKFGLSVKMSGGTRPTAPAGATEIDLDQIMSGFAGAAMEEDEDLGFGELPEEPA